MKKLVALCLLFISGAAQSQSLDVAWPYAAEERIYWIEGETVTITYSHTGAPAAISQAQANQVLADVEAKLNGLGLPGLRVQLGNRDLNTACNHRARNTVHICWEVRDGRRADSINTPASDGTDFWREGIIILGNNADWTDPTRPLYQQVQHYLLHILGFAHPEREPERAISVINNNSMDLTQLDIDGLRAMYGGNRCTLTLGNDGTITLPFVKYAGGGYTARLQYDGGSGLSILPGTIGKFGPGGYGVSNAVPLSPCHNLTIDGSNELHIPNVMVSGRSYRVTLRMTPSGSFTVADARAN